MRALARLAVFGVAMLSLAAGCRPAAPRATVTPTSSAFATVAPTYASSAVPATPTPPAGPPRTLVTQPALGGHRFSRPTDLGPYPGGRMYVVEQAGTIEVFAADGSSSGVLLDIRAQVSTAGNEEGFLGVAFAPGFPATPYVFVYYSVAGGERRTRLSRFEVRNDRAVAGSELVILEQPQPYANHKGGALRFGPDGMLYLGLGDGGSEGDPNNRGQDTGVWLGKILRIDVRNASADQPYVVPSDNPFFHQRGARPEIWALGLRNPWRIAFDPADGRLWAGDVGQDKIEEVDVIEAGKNYGWRRFEGNDCYGGPCDTVGLTFPVATYTHALGCSVTGGVVYRGRAVPALVGWYLYADYCSGRVWALPVAGGAPVALLGAGGVHNVTSFGLDEAGEVYLAQQGAPVLKVTGAG